MRDENQALGVGIRHEGDLDMLCESLRLEDLAEKLITAGVLSGAQFDRFFSEFESSVSKTSTVSAAASLLRSGMVTPYQMEAVLNDRIDRISLGEYTVITPLGAGGMGEVLLAVHRRMKRKVAIKFLPAQFERDPEMVRRFEREVELVAQLSHPNIVTAYDAGHAGDTHYLVMEYVDGCDLASIVKASGPLPVKEAVRCLLQAGQGIVHAHSKGIIHRDIKPGNLLADRDGTIKVLDMGLARWYAGADQSTASDLSATGAFLGTVDFMAPEQAVSAKSADHRSDIYGLGCTLYSLVHGRPVYEGETVLEKAMAHQRHPIPALLDTNWNQHAEVNRVFQTMLAKNPDDRYASAEAACQALAACFDDIDGKGDLRVRLAIPEMQVGGTGSHEETKDRLPEYSLVSTLAAGEPSAAAARQELAGKETPWWKRRSFAAFLALTLLVCAGIAAVPTVMRAVTPEGTLIVNCHIEGAIIELGNERSFKVTDPATKSEYSFELPIGEHQVRALLPDGTVIRSANVQIRSDVATLFDAKVERTAESQRDSAVETRHGEQAGSRSSEPLRAKGSEVEDTDRAPRVLLVAQDGAAPYATIQDAVAVARRGDTIRITDNGTYKETVHLTPALADYEGITIEATEHAKWTPADATGRVLVIQDVPGVTLKGLQFEISKMQHYGVIVVGDCAGASIQNCRFSTTLMQSGPSISLEGLQYSDRSRPVIIRNCRFQGGPCGIQVSGLANDDSPMRCGGLIVSNCEFRESNQPIFITGATHDAWIVSNILADASVTGIQVMHTSEDTQNVLIANNTLVDCTNPIRIWENGDRPAGVTISANVSVGGETDQWHVADSGGNRLFARSPGNGAEFARLWNFSHNFREGKAPSNDTQSMRAWIPPADTSHLVDQVELLSRDPNDENYLVPAPDSPVVQGGLGGDLPGYAGAVAPHGVASFDWERAYLRSVETE